MTVHTCAACGKEHPAKYVTAWGRDGHGDGYGPKPICTAIVPNPFALKASDGSLSQQVCGGQLIPSIVSTPV